MVSPNSVKSEKWVNQDTARVRKNNRVSDNFIKSYTPSTNYSNTPVENLEKSTKKSRLREREYLPRSSRLLVLMERDEVRTIYYISIVLTFLLFLQISFTDLTRLGRLRLGYEIFRKSFGTKIFQIVVNWIFMFSCVLSLYYLTRLWVFVRSHLRPSWIKYWDSMNVYGFITYQLIFLIGLGKYFYSFNFSLSAGLLLYCEQIRLLMKTHAFIREKIPQILHCPHENHLKFSKYCYFLFAPTLIYRDNYPRTTKTNWLNVLQYIGEMVGSLFVITQLAELFLIYELQFYGTKSMDWTVLVSLFLRNNFIAGVVCLCGFYFLLHSWHNAWAEVLRFADREFYEDWWNSISYQQYFRRWNLICHDWLYQYVYKEVYSHTKSSGKSVIAVFLISVFAHEYIMALSLRLFFPVMTFMFGVVGFGMSIYSKKLEKNAVTFGRIVFWTGVFVGNNMTFYFYTIEYYARQNCPSSSGLVRFVDCYQK